MDKKTVFIKTREGEEAVRERSRLAQSNLRSLLIMVDGHASVGDLARRFGDENAALAALAELQAGGLILEASGALDFTSTQVAETEPGSELPDLPPQLEPEQVPEAVPLPTPAPPPRQETPAAGPVWIERVKALFAAKGGKPAVKAGKTKEPAYEDGQTLAAVDLEPVRRGPKLGWPMLVLSAFLLFAVLPALTLLLYPYDRHLPDIERHATTLLQEPVKIGGIGFSFLPRPHIALHDITVGKQGQVVVASVRAQPDFLSLLGEKKVFNELAFDRATVSGAMLGRLARAGASGKTVEIRRMTLKDLSLAAGDVLLGGMGGEVKMADSGVVEAITLRNAEGTLKIEMQPTDKGFRFSAFGSNWKAPFRPGLVLQTIDVQGELRDARMDLSRIDGKAHEGLIEGKASLDWAGKASLAADLELRRMDAAKLLGAFESVLAVEGELSARLQIAAQADSLGKLNEALSVDGTFEMKRGVVRGFDLVEAARSASRAPTRGGETKFEQFGGTFKLDPQGYRLGSLRLVSGLFKAGGNLAVAGNAQLSGAIDAELKSSAATLRMSLAIGGTAKDPLLTPTRGR